MPQPPVTLTNKGRRWFQSGHPWIYRDDLAAPPAAASGDVVALMDPHGRFLAQTLYSAASRIALRLITREAIPIDRAFWEHRLRRALAYRARVVQDTDACRLIYSEADGFPGLIVDRYAGHLVLQVHHPGMERLLPELLELLQELTQPLSITLRNDSEARLLEGLSQGVATVYGQVPELVVIQEGGVRFQVDLLRGQKTGLFLDQRENRQTAATWGSGEVLDCFSYQGGFALHLATGARHVTAVETSAAAVAQAQANAQLNGRDNITWVQQNCFDFLKHAVNAGRTFDVIILDPPAFARRRTDRPAAQKGYREINRRALQLLAPGGLLVTCSCSYNIDYEEFLAILREASRDTGRQVRLIERRTAGRDHPALLSLPESSYLKCCFLLAD